MEASPKGDGIGRLAQQSGATSINAPVTDRSDPDWYKDAIIYQLHIKAFQDSNDDGIGDFGGLIQRLDYIQDLGVTTIWLLPFYPSPLRDDGYDIADYRVVNPTYGTMRDLRRFIAEAHRRNIRVVTELVINHTSDQHPWFQKARHAKPGSAARNFYVWSDTDESYQGTRIIFLDTEQSNWTWDPIAGAFFWHRFYSHQPDLNFDNPRVLKEVLRLMKMWLDMGVDGLRLDAIPYLVEREGTNNENLPETHAVLKRIRAALDTRYPDRMLLAEANQWPEDTRPYFGEGDECHMAFHFPLMPRMYMALAQEDRHPITDIIRQTPDIPENCQWAIFLRNHDELTLEMVTDEERDYLWQTYAADRRARINLGIRRRLAPLMQNDRRKIQLMNALLLSMPGTPVMYYGDEIGMGDNYYLGDRDGVRTPMQWSADRNAGFSRANPQQLFLPPIMDPIYGYQAINVEAQQSDVSSLLNWTKLMIAVRKQYAAFGRGNMIFLYPRNRKILAYVREHAGQTIFCVFNLSRSAQAVEIDLSKYRASVLIELTGRAVFPPVGDLPYLLTLPAYGFYWFLVTNEAEAPDWHEPLPEILPEFVTLTSRDGSVTSVVTGRERKQLEVETLPAFLPLQRWFGAKADAIKAVGIEVLCSMPDVGSVLAAVSVEAGRENQRYFLPLTARWGAENVGLGAPKLSYTLAKIRKGPRVGALIDGAYDESFAAHMIEAMRRGDEQEGEAGTVHFRGDGILTEIGELGDPRPLGVEQSNVSVAFGDQVILKLYRRLRLGEQPDVEVGRYLSVNAGYAHTPRLLGTVDQIDRQGETTTLAAAFAFVPNQGDAWSTITSALENYLEEHSLRARSEDAERLPEPIFPFDIAALLGQRTAELHEALSADTDDPSFQTEPLTVARLEAWSMAAVTEAEEMFRQLEGVVTTAAENIRPDVDALVASRTDILKRLRVLAKARPSGALSRIHGDFHLGQVLVAQNDLLIIDFEGEPRRSLEERRSKGSALRDVAGMLRSLDYAATMALGNYEQRVGEDPVAQTCAADWLRRSSADFLEAYRQHSAETASLPRPKLAATLLDFFTLQKAIYEIGYELAHRPTWVSIPARGILRILGRSATIS